MFGNITYPTVINIRPSPASMDDSPFGPLTQRLVSALIEDNLMTPMDDTMADIAGKHA